MLLSKLLVWSVGYLCVMYFDADRKFAVAVLQDLVVVNNFVFVLSLADFVWNCLSVM